MKLKSKKALLKRIKITGSKKIMRRAVHQGHFNAKDSGNTTRKKRKALLLPLRGRQAKKQLSSII